MTNKQKTKPHAAQKAQDNKLSQLQPLKLEQLKGVAGGPHINTNF